MDRKFYYGNLGKVLGDYSGNVLSDHLGIVLNIYLNGNVWCDFVVVVVWGGISTRT